MEKTEGSIFFFGHKIKEPVKVKIQSNLRSINIAKNSRKTVRSFEKKEFVNILLGCLFIH